MNAHFALRAAALALCGLLLALPAGSKSGGAAAVDAIGPVYRIAEDDLLSVIEAAAARDWERHLYAARERARQLLERPPRVAGIAAAEEDGVRHFDPTVRLAHAVTDRAGRTLFPAGTEINPLDYAPLGSKLLFFDGDDPVQTRIAADLAADVGGRVKAVMVGGPWLDLARKWPGRLYFDQGGALSGHFGIRETPALVEQDDRRLRIRTYAAGGQRPPGTE